MKWFTHDCDLSTSPTMRAIRAELGWAGYGQAIAVLEILGKETKEGVQFQLPLTKATDLKFWSREFLTSPEETERIFDIFEQSDLILPWRDTQVICAPMLGNRLDEWTRRKQKHTKSRPQPEPPKNPEPPGKQQKQENEQNSNRKEQNRTPTPTEQAPESLGRTPESLPSDEAVRWVMKFFQNLGQVPDKKKVVSLFEGRDEEAVKGTCEQFRKKANLDSVKFPFSIFLKQFDVWYSPDFRTSEFVEQQQLTNIGREREKDEQEKAAKVLVVAAQSGWKEDPTAI